MILVLGATGFLGKRVIKKLEEANKPHHATSLSLGCDLMDPYEVDMLFKQTNLRVLLIAPLLLEVLTLAILTQQTFF